MISGVQNTNKANNNYRQNPVCKGYCMSLELNDILQSGCYKFTLGYDKVDWFVDEVMELGNRMNFYPKNT